MNFAAISWERLAVELAERAAGVTPADGAARVRVAVDGAPGAGGGELAGLVAEELRVRGRAAVVVAAEGFLRPASLRLEWGKRDADAYYDEWLDVGALWREVFGPLEAGGSGRVLPDLWDPVADRATRSPYVEVPEGGVVILEGALLLRHWFPFDLAVHLRLSEGALARRVPEELRWALPAFARYEAEAAPGEAADAVVRADDPRRPAWSGWAIGG
ncbi:uridine kinase [Streptomyces boninensis]|uniref:uridine kinase n=1 Tax=Streptomyces boninensis TaxID=2039455 RepID=UPI003B221830